jgi:hypothetical protein
MIPPNGEPLKYKNQKMKKTLNLLIIAMAMVGMLVLSSVQRNLIGIIPDALFIGLLTLEMLLGMCLTIASVNEENKTEFWLSLVGIILGIMPSVTLFIGLL